MKKLALLFLLVSSPCYAWLEKDYQKTWCDNVGGKMEVVLDDSARVDCLTDKYAIEFDFGHKWAESVGQAIYYAIKTDRLPGVVLIVGPDDGRYITRLKAVSNKTWIKIWFMEKWPEVNN